MPRVSVMPAYYPAIWAVVKAIPPGQVCSYGAVARRAGLPNGARQVARALQAAPPSLKLPWHRVVGANGRLCLPADSAAGKRQRQQLQREGVRLNARRVSGSSASLDELLWGQA